MGSALMGSLQLLCFSTEGLFVGTPVNLLSSSPKCQGVPSFPICQSSLSENELEFCVLISVDPICPQPNDTLSYRLSTCAVHYIQNYSL